MSALEDKLLGETATGYCSSSDEGEEEIFGGCKIDPDNKGNPPPPPQNFPQDSSRTSCNTGPKGVLRDWQLFKEHEAKLKHEKEAEFIALCAQKALTCNPSNDDNCIPKELEDELLEEATLSDFLKKRMEMMIKNTNEVPVFGQLVDIPSGDEYLKIVDEAHKKVTVVIHIYEQRSPECAKMNQCLATVSNSYHNVMFCKILGSNVGVSRLFKTEGVPAILVYKNGNLIGNFIRLKEEFGSEFYSGDVENFLIENGILEDKGNTPAVLLEKLP